jgi:hypothetical protein
MQSENGFLRNVLGRVTHNKDLVTDQGQDLVKGMEAAIAEERDKIILILKENKEQAGKIDELQKSMDDRQSQIWKMEYQIEQLKSREPEFMEREVEKITYRDMPVSLPTVAGDDFPSDDDRDSKRASARVFPVRIEDPISEQPRAPNSGKLADSESRPRTPARLDPVVPLVLSTGKTMVDCPCCHEMLPIEGIGLPEPVIDHSTPRPQVCEPEPESELAQKLREELAELQRQKVSFDQQFARYAHRLLHAASR